MVFNISLIVILQTKLFHRNTISKIKKLPKFYTMPSKTYHAKTFAISEFIAKVSEFSARTKTVLEMTLSSSNTSVKSIDNGIGLKNKTSLRKVKTKTN